ncbi:MAG: L-threonylcarbamoyladenylate synthase [Firmicutes bacterium]|nr:L-threonylcarbamoyladenylate synthase [Bacillota bacterium]
MVDSISKAANIIKDGGIVAFPTETVYGLGADAFNAAAVKRVYSAKGRPVDNPLILHVANLEQFLELVEPPPEYALALAKAYWPGPLTLIAKKKYHLPSWVGGHPQNSTNTVGVRVPNHPAALAFLEAVGSPIAAPSANKSGRPSPTSAKHVTDDFSATGEIDIVLDGNISNVGLESTVVDVTGQTPVILRPGAITREMIHEVTQLQSDKAAHTDAPRSPGMKYRHYAPKAPMTILQGGSHAVATHIILECEARPEQLLGAYVTEAVKNIIAGNPSPNIKYIILSDNPETAAQNLFADFRQFDKLNVSAIYAEAVAETGLGTAIMDRMKKAADGNILNVGAVTNRPN